MHSGQACGALIVMAALVAGSTLAARLSAGADVATAGDATQEPPPAEHYRLVPGFVAERFNDEGMALGTGFAAPNPWGAYTAYLLVTNEKGQRTWRAG